MEQSCSAYGKEKVMKEISNSIAEVTRIKCIPRKRLTDLVSELLKARDIPDKDSG